MTENKRFEIKIGEFEEENIVDNLNRMTIREISDMCKKMNELNDEKEFWKSMCCSQSNFNQILLNELDIAQEQGYEVSNPFKKLIEKKEILE